MTPTEKEVLAYFIIVIVAPFAVVWMVILLVFSLMAGSAGVG